MSSLLTIKSSKLKIIPIRFGNLDQLYKSYMPFLKNGGLFLPTNVTFSMGQSLMLVIQLPDIKEKFQVLGSVIWVTPENADNHRKCGVGMEFTDSAGISLGHRIMGLLSDRKDSDTPTYTL